MPSSNNDLNGDTDESKMLGRSQHMGNEHPVKQRYGAFYTSGRPLNRRIQTLNAVALVRIFLREGYQILFCTTPVLLPDKLKGGKPGLD